MWLQVSKSLKCLILMKTTFYAKSQPAHITSPVRKEYMTDRFMIPYQSWDHVSRVYIFAHWEIMQSRELHEIWHNDDHKKSSTWEPWRHGRDSALQVTVDVPSPLPIFDFHVPCSNSAQTPNQLHCKTQRPPFDFQFFSEKTTFRKSDDAPIWQKC